MDKINSEKLSNFIFLKNNIVKFHDDINEYSFNLSKSTLYKRFHFKNPVEQIEVKIKNDPFGILLNKEIKRPQSSIKVACKDFIYLPLYAPSDIQDFTPGKKSGLNLWNASGRNRSHDEVYIPVPAQIHKFNFLPNNTKDKFTIVLPNGEELDCKMCQSGAKRLMSNPNKALGKWLLRDILKLEPGKLVTREIFNELGIDSVYLEKVERKKYVISFAKSGSFEDFKSIHLS